MVAERSGRTPVSRQILLNENYYRDPLVRLKDKQEGYYQERQQQAKQEWESLLKAVKGEAYFENLKGEKRIVVLHVCAGSGAATMALREVLQAKFAQSEIVIICVDIDPRARVAHDQHKVAYEQFVTSSVEGYLSGEVNEAGLEQPDLIMGLLVTGEVVAEVIDWLNQHPESVLGLFTTSAPGSKWEPVLAAHVQDHAIAVQHAKVSQAAGGAAWLYTPGFSQEKGRTNAEFIVGNDPDSPLRTVKQEFIRNYQPDDLD